MKGNGSLFGDKNNLAMNDSTGFFDHQDSNAELCAILLQEIEFNGLHFVLINNECSIVSWMMLSNFHQALVLQRQNLNSFMSALETTNNDLIASATCDVCIFINSRPLPATVESSILLLWVKGDSVEAEAISWPPIALLSKPSISAKEKQPRFP